MAKPAPIEVHEEKGEVVERVDGRDRLVELYGVEEHRPTLPQHDVAEVQVAVTAAHTTPPGALVQRLGGPSELSLGVAAEAGSILAGEGVQLGERAAERHHEGVHWGGAGGSNSAVGPLMAVVGGVRHGFRQVRADAARLSDVAEQCRLLEPAHVHGPLDDLSATAQGQASAG